METTTTMYRETETTIRRAWTTTPSMRTPEQRRLLREYAVCGGCYAVLPMARAVQQWGVELCDTCAREA